MVKTLLRNVVTSLILACSLTSPSQAAGLSFEAGIGYDFLSQEYFLDSAVLSGEDSALTQWALTTEYLDDLKGRFGLILRPSTGRDWEARLSYDQTADFLRLRLDGQRSWKIRESKLALNCDMETRDRHRGAVEPGDDYFQAEGRIKLATPVSEFSTLKLQLRGDGVSFGDPAEYVYNYYRVGGQVGLERSFGGFSFGSLSLFGIGRQVPDSSSLDYFNLGGEASFFGYYSTGDGSAVLRVEDKAYEKQNDQDDHVRFELDASNRVRFGEQWFSRQELDLEAVAYDPDDIVNRDYSRRRLSVVAGIDRIAWSAAAGSDFEFLREDEIAGVEAENYAEYAARFEFDWVDPGRVFLSFETLIGYRDMEDEGDFQSDFTFLRPTLISNLGFGESLNLSFIFSADWEWHNRSEDNARTFLLSSNLTYSF